MNQQQIKQLETKIEKIQTFINNWEKEIMNYKNTLREITKQVSDLKTNSKNSK